MLIELQYHSKLATPRFKNFQKLYIFKNKMGNQTLTQHQENPPEPVLAIKISRKVSGELKVKFIFTYYPQM